VKAAEDLPLPTVTDLQLAELLTVAAKKGKRLDRITRVTVNVERKKLILWRAPLCYDVTPLGFDVLAKNNHRLKA
jgi:hypothetical protein